ncbi:hypothetical protein L1049_016844 [Liquidambar formosana]|uniref:Uncharacterized protein n=1 Tax=Liquidambar formosana TaxID=63359 RepID=A0AAP0S278_LIQFO
MHLRWILSEEHALWLKLLLQDFPGKDHSSGRPPKTRYKILWVRDKFCKLECYDVRFKTHEVKERLSNVQILQRQLANENDIMEASAEELANLGRSGEGSVSREMLVEQFGVITAGRINALEMEIRLCKLQIKCFNNAYKEEKRRLDIAEEQLASLTTRLGILKKRKFELQENQE